MTLLEIANQFKTVTDSITGLNGFSFGWPSDRTRQVEYDSPGEYVASFLYPRVFFAVPTLEHNQTTRRDLYQVEIFFDDLLGYDDTGETDDSTQIEKWANLLGYAEQWVREMQTKKTTGVIDGTVNMVLDSFGSTQRLITVRASFTLATLSTC